MKFIKNIGLIMLLILMVVICYENKIKTIETKHSEQIAKYDVKIESLENINMKLKNYKVKVSFYVPSIGGINSQGNPNTTAVLDKPIPGGTLAVSRDLIHLLYRTIYVKGYGVFYANDTLADKDPYTKKPIRKQIDICVGSLKHIPKQGVFYNIPIAVKF